MRLIDVRSSLPLNPNPRRRYKRRKLKKITKIVIHSTGTGEPNLVPLARYDVTPRPDHHISPKGCPGFTYHYYVGRDEGQGDPNIFFTSDLENITWHAGKHNKNSIGVCMKYKYQGNPNPPSDGQLQALYRLLVHLCLELKIDPDNIRGHRELRGTGYKIVNGVKKLRKPCPGMLVNMDALRNIIARGVQTVLKTTGYYNRRVDGIFGPLSEKALKQYHEKNQS
jgi:N-acetyl-anhydromuramyl-L-alanine amidase AmpD